MSTKARGRTLPGVSAKQPGGPCGWNGVSEGEERQRPEASRGPGGGRGGWGSHRAAKSASQPGEEAPGGVDLAGGEARARGHKATHPPGLSP